MPTLIIRLTTKMASGENFVITNETLLFAEKGKEREEVSSLLLG